MPAHQRTRSAQRASSLPPSSPPRQTIAAREKARRTPIVPSARRKQALESRAENSSASRHLQAALALLPNGGSRKAAAPTKLGSPITLRPSKPAGCAMTIQEENEDEDMVILPAPMETFDKSRGAFYESLQARAFDWRQDPFEDSPVYVHGQRPNFKHRHKRSSSYAAASSSSSLRPPPARTLQPTLLSATPSPHISAANSPVPTPLALTSDLDFSLFLEPGGAGQGWPRSNSAFLSTPAFSTPGLSPSASSTSGSPLVPPANEGYFAQRTRRTPRTPHPAPY